MTLSPTKRQATNQYYEEPIAEGVMPLQMMRIPAGTFMMGSPAKELARSNQEGPPQEITVPQFFMSQYPVTQAQWRAVAAFPQVNRAINPDPSAFKDEQRPVDSISWHDAVEFCDRLTQHVRPTPRTFQDILDETTEQSATKSSRSNEDALQEMQDMLAMSENRAEFLKLQAMTRAQIQSVREEMSLDNDIDENLAARMQKMMAEDPAVVTGNIAGLPERPARQYRLPSESEWEYACRANTTTPFHFGETLSTDYANYDGSSEKTGAYGPGSKGDYRKTTTPIGQFEGANEFGLCDMHGNVWEWCADHWHNSYQGIPTDGSAWVTGGKDDMRMLRGGSWLNAPNSCRSAARFSIASWDRDYIIGFRVSCVAVGKLANSMEEAFPWLEEARAWAEADTDGELSAVHVSGHPEVTARLLILKRLPPATSWRELSAEYGVSVKTLSSFYQRQCLPRLKAFGQSQGYMES